MDAPGLITPLNAALEGHYKVEREIGEGGVIHLGEVTLELPSLGV